MHRNAKTKFIFVIEIYFYYKERKREKFKKRKEKKKILRRISMNRFVFVGCLNRGKKKETKRHLDVSKMIRSLFEMLHSAAYDVEDDIVKLGMQHKIHD